MQIRLMKKDDIKAVVELLVKSHSVEDKTRRWEEEYATRYVTMLYRLTKDLCFVATNGNSVIGVSLSLIVPEYNKYVVDSKVLLVEPKYRKQKIGTRLLKKMCLKAHNKYCIDVVETNIYTLTNFPISWYESMGFKTKKCYETTRCNIQEVLKII